MPIVVLSAQTINKIAAGEVIDCPASVVKELVENSIDAGAKAINVHVDKGGRNLISVSDDGCGIACEEMEKAFIGHATSKLIDGDLANVKTMGFRGEGLTAVASVARVKMVSKHVDAERAWSITFEGGEKTRDLTPGVLSCGTHVEVRDLFFATPTRLKFLRTEKAEMQNIVDLLNRLAMINYTIAFSLTIVERQIFKYSAQGSLIERLKEMRAFGEVFCEQSLEINHSIDHVRVYGHIGLPTFNKSKPGMVHTFVNGRPIYSTLLLGAVKSAYHGLIPKDRHPVVVLALDVMPAYVDVNVHPSKMEVRFQDKRLVYKAVLDALGEALSSNVYARFSPAAATSEGHDHFAMDSIEKTYGKFFSGDTEAASTMQLQPEALNHNIPLLFGSSHVDDSKRTHDTGFCADHTHHHDTKGSVHTKSFSARSSSFAESKMEQGCMLEEPPLGYAVCQLFERYIISRAGDYVIIVDQHAAHERLVCEYIKKVTEQEGIKRQVLLMPEFIELGNEYELELLTEYREKLRDLGLIVEPMGDLTVVVREVPAIFGVVDAKALISKILESIMAKGDELFVKGKLSHICGTVACYSSIRSGRIMKLEEMNSLLRHMESTPHSGQCNHGRPTYVKLKLSEIDKLFERT
ncbi:DNA mismatch repair endonuclease MutL [Anaplasma phagocytophilum]|uniref:DNA mismatch repair protein MutL n=1 Tax=Anaplasma phagocytophilum str. CRT38 TaxID=1269275 RepID=S6GB77_ANAPH|nr:DNA mismatch repair endonuclease MutL [Anaplasma phagocytophilum]EOA62379.1 DNA mismatch repair protein MutL [Anaplasma phagocytophilum str. CRT38]KDB57170.1 DNA mismatch repair protein MutL [Anaplasma phagocytophilum str. CRT35]